MTGRAPCCLPFCKRTIRTADHPPHYSEFMCARCWRGVPRALKTIKRRSERELQRAAALQAATHIRSTWVAERRAIARESRVWRICKREAMKARGM